MSPAPQPLLIELVFAVAVAMREHGKVARRECRCVRVIASSARPGLAMILSPFDRAMSRCSAARSDSSPCAAIRDAAGPILCSGLKVDPLRFQRPVNRSARRYRAVPAAR